MINTCCIIYIWKHSLSIGNCEAKAAPNEDQ